MQIMPIDVTDLVATVMALLVVLIPIAGVTARFALKPLVESIGTFMQVQGSEEALRMSERRIALLEQNLGAVQEELHRVREAQDFDHALRSGSKAEALPASRRPESDPPATESDSPTPESDSPAPS